MVGGVVARVEAVGVVEEDLHRLTTALIFELMFAIIRRISLLANVA